ncbi:MAG TPA: hypothetical protein VMW83_16225 [Spirochaetia bacterium]|nr:hypothetical protein [Spirochaetia bacterium]
MIEASDFPLQPRHVYAQRETGKAIRRHHRTSPRSAQVPEHRRGGARIGPSFSRPGDDHPEREKGAAMQVAGPLYDAVVQGDGMVTSLWPCMPGTSCISMSPVWPV